MKKYSRKALIRYFEKLPPRSRPCPENEEICPLVVAGFARTVDSAETKDKELTNALDAASAERWDWHGLTAARIVRIAKSLP